MTHVKSSTFPVIVKSVHEQPSSPKSGLFHRFKRTPSVLVLVSFFVLMFSFMGVGGGVLTPTAQSTSSANAAIFDICKSMAGGDSLAEIQKAGPLYVWPGSNLLTPDNQADDGSVETNYRNLNNPTKGKPYADSGGTIVPTAQEWYGVAPLRWQTWMSEELDSKCDVGSIIGSFFANLVLNIVSMLVQLGIAIVGNILSLNATSYFAETVGDLIDALKDSLFLTYLYPIVLLGTLWIAYNGLVKKRTSVATQGIVWMLMSGVLSLAFLINGSQAVKAYSDFVQKVTLSMISLPLSAEVNNDKNEEETALCYAKGENAELRAATCSIWETFLYSPWASGQFGSGATEKLMAGEGVEGFSYISGHGKTLRLPYVWMEMFTVNYDQVVGGEDKYPPLNTPDAPDTPNSRQEMMNVVWASLTTISAEDNAKLTEAKLTVGGLNSGSQITTAFIALIAVIAGALPLFILAITLLGYQIATVFILVLAPLFLTVGIHPGFGRRIALTWVEMLLSNFLKRLTTGLLIGILLVLMQSAVLM